MYPADRAQIETTMGYIVMVVGAFLLLLLAMGLAQVGHSALTHWVG
jgi:hypothetical protein